MTTRKARKQHIFFLSRTNNEAMRLAQNHLRELGVRITNRQGDAALMGLATPDQVEAAYETGLFAAITAKPHFRGIAAANTQPNTRKRPNSGTPSKRRSGMSRRRSGRMKAGAGQIRSARRRRRITSSTRATLSEPCLSTSRSRRSSSWSHTRMRSRPTSRAGASPPTKDAWRAPMTIPPWPTTWPRMAWHLEPAYRLALLKLPIEFVIAFFPGSGLLEDGG